jgi:chromosome partitioning protein
MTPIVICSRKGGSAKTTIACELATLARGLIVDLDSQASATAFWKKRQAELPRCVSGSDTSKLAGLDRAGDGYAFIDTPPSVTKEVQVAVGVASLCIIPVRPAFLDLVAIKDTTALVRGKKALIVLTFCPPARGTATGVVAEARRALSVYGIAVAPPVLTHRVAFQHAANAGLSVTEFAPSSPASDEMRRLWEYVRAQA